MSDNCRLAGVWPVISYVREEMQSRGWSEDDLLSRLALNRSIAERTWQRVKTGQRFAEFEAQHLARAFGTTTELWQNLDNAFWDALASELYYLRKDSSRTEAEG